jgi:hypothetical protein
MGVRRPAQRSVYSGSAVSSRYCGTLMDPEGLSQGCDFYPAGMPVKVTVRRRPGGPALRTVTPQAVLWALLMAAHCWCWAQQAIRTVPEPGLQGCHGSFGPTMITSLLCELGVS